MSKACPYCGEIRDRDGELWDFYECNTIKNKMPGFGYGKYQRGNKCYERQIARKDELLRRAVETMNGLITMMDKGDKPRKLDEALAWRENDELARNSAKQLAADIEAELGRG